MSAAMEINASSTTFQNIRKAASGTTIPPKKQKIEKAGPPS
ncbi:MULTISPECIES: hypothetical protein [Stenotrophomonas]